MKQENRAGAGGEAMHSRSVGHQEQWEKEKTIVQGGRGEF